MRTLIPSKTSVSEPDFLRLPSWVVSELCAGPVRTTSLGILRNGQHNLRRLSLLALLDAIRNRRTELGHLLDAESILTEAEERDPRVVADILNAPTVGVWLARALRQSLGAPDDGTATEAELGWLHCVAAAAAVRTGMTCAIPLPVMHGGTFLPTVGGFSLPTGTSADRLDLRIAPSGVTATACGGTVAVPLEPVFRHRTTAGDLTLDTIIDFSDPYRRFSAPEPADVIDAGRRTRWTEQLDEAWRILTRWHPGYAEELAAGLMTIVPLPVADNVFAASSSSAFGSVAMSPKRSAAEFAEALVHELQHSKLNALLDLTQLCCSGPAPWLYAPWRDDCRPIFGLLHGIYSFVSIVEFWAVQRSHTIPTEKKRAEFAFHYRRSQLRSVIEAVHSHPGLTDLGREFVAGVEKRLAAHALTEVSAEVDSTVRDLTADHYAAWRLRHVRVAPRSVDALAEAWTAGRPAVIESMVDDVVPSGQVQPSPRADLLKHRLLKPHLFDQLADDGPDSAFVKGDHESAATGYLDRIRTDPDDTAAWIGYGLATNSPSLRHRPEMVHATQARLSTAADPSALVAWFDQSPVWTDQSCMVSMSQLARIN